MDFELWGPWLALSPFIVLMAWVFWSIATKKNRHTRKLAALANELGGTVSIAGAWSGALRWPLAVVPPVDLALDFQRGRWQVRVTQTSMTRASFSATTGPGPSIAYEHTIDIAVAGLSPMRISRHLSMDWRGRPRQSDDFAMQEGAGVSVAPVTVRQMRWPWVPVRWPAPIDHDFTVFTSDPGSTTRALNPRAAEWLNCHVFGGPELSKLNPSLRTQPTYDCVLSMELDITVEAGLLYVTTHGRIDPGRIVRTVDALVGFLDRIPQATPPHPVPIR